MMNVRSIHADEALLFARVSGPDASADWVLRLWESGESRPAWCFIAEHDGVPVARVAYVSFASARGEVELFALHLPWDGDAMRAGRHLLLESLRAMLKEGARIIEYQFAAAAPHADERSALCEMIGLAMVQRKERFILDAREPVAGPDAELRWRSLAEVGEAAFLTATERVSVDGLDRMNAATVSERGLAWFARSFFTTLRAIDDRPSWWELAYDATDALVGLIVPQRFTPGEGAINYIGVVPESRGRGYVDALLRRGVARLRENGINKVIGDTDSQNTPMASAFLRAGFAPAGSRLVYHGLVSGIVGRG